MTQIEIAVDGLTIFVSRGQGSESPVEACLKKGLTYNQLRWIFSDLSTSELEDDGFDASELENDNGDGIKQWSDLYPDCPSTEIQIYAPDDASGTQAYFGEEIFNHNMYEAGTEYFYGDVLLSDSNDIIADSVKEDESGIGFAGYAHYFVHDNTLFAIPLCQNECAFSTHYIAPSSLTINEGSYPLSRKMLSCCI